jgi:hypothetical protein
MAEKQQRSWFSGATRADLQEQNEDDVMGSRDGYRHTSRD